MLKCPDSSVARLTYRAKQNPKHQQYDISSLHGVADKANCLDSLFGGSHMAGVTEAVSWLMIFFILLIVALFISSCDTLLTALMVRYLVKLVSHRYNYPWS